MKRIILLFLIFRSFLSYADDISSATAVVQRRIPQISPNLSFASIPSQNGYDVFEVQATGGNVIIKGSSPTAMCRGLYDYLKVNCKCLITWEGDQLNLPNPLPNTPLRRVVSSVLYKQYFNVVTFGYSTMFWDWERWEKEIDWMAFHGINMPLAMNGQEKIWQQIWKGYGCTDTDLTKFFTGPAFLAWNRMGNVYGSEGCLSMVGGSLPQSFIDNDALLQKKILTREVELGMKPVIPGFSGFIPRAIKTIYPNSKTWVPTAWNNATPATLALHPLDTMFASLTKKYIEQYKSYYGDVSNFYLIDLFNEIDPPAGTTLKDLGIISKSAYNSLLAADSKATWVIQGWCFSYQAYWRNTANTTAFLDSVPDNKMIVLDLQADADEVFRLHTSIAKKLFIWDMLQNNWGQHTQLSGNLDVLATKPMTALATATNTHMVGMGMADEGIEHNSVTFELMTDNMWRTTPFTVSQWVADWSKQRYGTTDDSANNIWSQMYTLFYKSANDPKAPYQNAPSTTVSKNTPSTTIRTLLTAMLNAPAAVQNNLLFQRDLVDVAKRYVGDNIQTSIWKVVTGIQTKDPKTPVYRAEFDSLMLGLDALLGTQKQHRLDTWTNAAKAYVGAGDKDFLEKNARLQLTTWVAPSWQGYARKEWSGIVGDFYRTRWNRFFDALAVSGFNQNTFNTSLYNWSNAWCSNTTLFPTYNCKVVPQTKYLLMLSDKMYAGITEDSLGIAYNKPVTATSYENNDPNYVPTNITDGATSGKFWSATSAPQSVTIDLLASNTITLIKVYPYYDGTRYYQYKVEGSLDNVNWFQLADNTSNTSPGSTYGFLHVVNEVSARYVKVTMTKNSANPGLHLYEVRVFGQSSAQSNQQPVFNDKMLICESTASKGKFVAKFDATDADANQILSYSLVDAYPANVFSVRNDSLMVNDLSLVGSDKSATVYLKVTDSGIPQRINYARYLVNVTTSAGIKKIQMKSTLLFPNPATVSVTVKLKEFNNDLIELINEAGQVVIRTTAHSNEHNLSLAKVSAGTYLLRVSNSKYSETQKLSICKK